MTTLTARSASVSARVMVRARAHAIAAGTASNGSVAVANRAGGAGTPAHHIQYDADAARYAIAIAAKTRAEPERSWIGISPEQSQCGNAECRREGEEPELLVEEQRDEPAGHIATRNVTGVAPYGADGLKVP